LHSESHIKDSMVSAQQEQRRVKSEHGSPLLSPSSNLDLLNGQLPPLDLSSIPGDYNFMQNIDGFSSIPDHEQPMFSAGLSSASIDWSHYDGLDFNNDNYGASSYSQAPSFTGFDFSSIDQPALTTTSTSGEISEVEDFVPLNDNAGSRPSLLNQQYGSDFDTSDFGGDIDGYRLSTASSYIGMPAAQMLAGNNLDALDMETFLKGAATSSGLVSNRGLPSNFSDEDKVGQIPSPYEEGTNYHLLEDENDSFWMNTYGSDPVTLNASRSEVQEENVWAQ